MKPEDVWDVKKQATEPSDVMLDDAHLDAPTWHYIVGWFLFASIRYLGVLAMSVVVYLVFEISDVNVLLIVGLLDGPLLLLSLYISHGLIFTRTNMRKVFPWFFLVFVGGYASVNEPEAVQAFADGGIDHSLLEILFSAGILFFIFFSYRYFTNLEPTRWVAKIKKEE
jgi:hypothetical protein